MAPPHHTRPPRVPLASQISLFFRGKNAHRPAILKRPSQHTTQHNTHHNTQHNFATHHTGSTVGSFGRDEMGRGRGGGGAEGGACYRLGRSVGAMKGVPGSLWLVFLLKVLESFAYFSMSLNMVVYLSEEFGMSDGEAGWFYGALGVLTSLYGLLTGPVIDVIGVRRSLVVGATLSAGGRLIFGLTHNVKMVYLSGMFLMPFGMAFGIPVLTIAVKRYTGPETRTFGFGLFYMVMNIAALISGPATDLCNGLIPEQGIKLFDTHITPLRALFLIGAVVTALQIVFACCLSDVIVEENSGTVSTYDPMKSLKTQTGRAAYAGVLKETFFDSSFWKLVVFSLVLLSARMIFRHVDATLPKWMTRTISPHALYGSVYAINPAIIIALVPLIAAMAPPSWSSYDMITYGAAVSTSSAFWLCADSAYWNAIVFMVQLSIGEAIYSPKVYEYSMHLAPKGKEGLYTVLASAPMFAAKFFVGGISGILLEEYCPQEGKQRCWVMWLIISLISITSPMFLYCLRGWIDSDSRRISTERMVQMQDMVCGVQELDDFDDENERNSLRIAENSAAGGGGENEVADDGFVLVRSRVSRTLEPTTASADS